MRAGLAARCIEGDGSTQCGYRVGADPMIVGDATAIFAGNDRMALGLGGLASRSVRVPDDISVAGFDDMPESAYLSPSRTTVHRDFEGGGSRGDGGDHRADRW